MITWEDDPPLGEDSNPGSPRANRWIGIGLVVYGLMAVCFIAWLLVDHPEHPSALAEPWRIP